MSYGKYSPTITRELANRSFNEFCYNAKGELPPSTWDVYCEEIHFGNYDKDGFDSYGYSAYDADGNYAGIGSGVDRDGITEYEYSVMSQEEFAEYF